MKKNAMLKIAAILLVAVLLTTCAISSTFAKYVTTGTEGTATARVAKWGIQGETTMTDLFKTSYTSSNGSVLSVDSGKLVAPGTSSKVALTTAVTNADEVEVSYKVTYAAELTLTGFNAYCPIVFDINGTTYSTNDANGTNKSDDVADLASDVEAAIAALVGGTGANGTFTDATIQIGWSWALNTSDAVDNEINEKDTALGDAGAAEITLEITPTFVQTGPAVAA